MCCAVAAGGPVVVPAAEAQTPCEERKLLPDRGAVGDKFGYDVDYDGVTAVVGAFQQGEDPQEAGAAYVFLKMTTGWELQQKVVADDADIGDWFGWSLAVDGDTLIVGARADDDQGGNSGSVYVFVHDGEQWTQQIKLLADDGVKADLFGHSVALDGDTAVVGAINDDGERGAVYVFLRGEKGWEQQIKLVAFDAFPLDEFGTSVAVDGDTIAVGSIGDDDNGSNSGSVYVYVDDGKGWSFQDKLKPEDGSTSDNFGTSLGLQGDTLIIGSVGDDGATGSGYVFTRAGGSWSEQQKLVAGDADSNDQFGESLSLDGDLLVVGAWNDDTTASATGSAYLYRLGEGGAWIESGHLIAGDAAQSDNFAGSVALIDDVVLIGAPNNDDFGENSGAAYVFQLEPAPGDIDCDGEVGIEDFLGLLAAWGPCPGPCPPSCPADVDGDCVVGIVDLLILLANWG